MNDQFIEMNIRQKVRIKIQQMNIDTFLNQILIKLIDYVLVYSNQDNNAKRFKTRRHYLPKRIIDNNNVIINGEKIIMINQLILI